MPADQEILAALVEKIGVEPKCDTLLAGLRSSVPG
jgi:hypothetical protein